MTKLLSRRRFLASAMYVFVGIGILIATGLYQYFLALPYDTSYVHWGPPEPLTSLIQQLQENGIPAVKPVNEFDHKFTFTNSHKCQVKDNEVIRLVYIVKSALPNFYKRDMIRQSWGFEQRFSDVTIRTVFLVGSMPGEPHLQVRVNKENKQHKDIVQADFIDNYYNNTIKTMMGLNWAFNFCAKVKYLLFVDDDYYVSTRNILRFLRDPNNYPQYLETYVIDAVNEYQENLYAGYVFQQSYPHRWVLSKWYISLTDYPYSHYPPYVTAGAFILSQRSLQSMYYASIYTNRFRFDDIFMGMCAKKANLHPFHHAEFHFSRPLYTVEGYKYTIASHGFGDPEEMHKIWEEQRSVGNA
uniref:Hexosyltransferase n=1 Tax=Hirondellea gigas TaxID=1518452 RepID=A0A2P2I6P5_9CRUS